MRLGTSHILMLGLLAGTCLTGCSRKVAIENPIRITAEEYDRVFESAVDVLRNELFVIDRQDRRFGVITTDPLWSSSLSEPWRTDNTTFYQTLDSTLNYHRRTVSVWLKPQDQPVAIGATGEPIGDPDYWLEVNVALERRQHPDRQLNTAAISSVGFVSRSGRARRLGTERGDEESFWRPMGRDEYLEQRLVNLILARASIVRERHDTEDVELPPDDVPEIQ